MAALLAGCPDDGTPITSITDGDTESTSSSEEETGDPTTQTTTLTTSADTTVGETTDGTVTMTDPTTDTDPSDTDESSSTDPTDASSSSEGGGVCGDDVADKGEDCDGSDLAGQDCASQGFDAGKLACSDDCTFDTAGCVVNCGNGVVDDGEDCDGTDLADADCVSEGYDAGELGCTVACTFDTFNCINYACGDNVIQNEEVCDGTELSGQDCTTQGFEGGELACANNCSGYDTAGCWNGSPCQDSDLGSAVGAAVAAGNLGGDDNDLDAGCGGSGGNDHVMAFTAPSDGLFVFDTINSNFDTKLALFSDCFTELACNDDTFGVQSQVSLEMTAGQEILVVVDGFNGAVGDWVLNISPPPVCGDGVLGFGEPCDGAELGGQDCLSQGFGGGGVLACDASCEFDTSGCIPSICGNGVVELGESCDGDDIGTQTCINLGVPPSGDVSSCCISNGGPGCDDMTCQDTVCAVDAFCCNTTWDGQCAREAAQMCDDALCPDPLCNEGCNGFVTATCDTDLSCAEAGIGSAVGPAVSSGTTVGEDEDIAQSCGAGGVDRMINWVAPADGTYVFDLVGSNYDTVLQLFGDCTAASSLACNDDALPGAISQITIDLTAGQSIMIAISGFAGNTGDYVLNITPPASAIPLETLDGCDPAYCTFTAAAGPNGGDLCSCTIEGGNHPDVNDYGDATCFGGTPAIDMLWSFNLAGYTQYSVTTCNVNAGDSAIAVYDADPALGGVQQACSEDASGEPAFCSEITDSGGGAAQGLPTAAPASGNAFILIDEWNPGNFWNGTTARQLDLELIP